MTSQNATDGTTRRNPPFQNLSFMMVENKRGRKLFRMTQQEDGFNLHVEVGSAANPSSQFTRVVPLEVAQRLKDALDRLGVFSWEESYGDKRAPGSVRWSLNTVFKENVFSVASKGGSDVPPQFNAFLEELYRLDFPRPEGSARGAGLDAGAGEKPVDALSAFAESMYGDGAAQGPGSINPDLAKLFEGMPQDVLDRMGNVNAGDALDALSYMRKNPTELFAQLKEAYVHMSPEERDQLLDALGRTGMASRAWWERFFRGL